MNMLALGSVLEDALLASWVHLKGFQAQHEAMHQPKFFLVLQIFGMKRNISYTSIAHFHQKRSSFCQ